MLKGQNGITLVALVITIIILLILAGVTISLTLGENGLFNTAKDAAKNYSNAAAEEGLLQNKIEHYVHNIVNNGV